MGFGSAPAGTGLAGLDEPGTTAARIASRPRALAFDGLSKDFLKDAEGRFVEQHPIDAKYFNRIRIAVGSIRSSIATGQGVANLKWIDPRTIEAFVRDQVNQVSVDMIEAGEITLHNVEIDLSVPGRVTFAPDYTNLKTGKRQSLKPSP